MRKRSNRVMAGGVLVSLALFACSSSSSNAVSGGDGGSGGTGLGSGGTATPPDCPGIAGRFGGPQPEGAVICEKSGPGVLICKGGQWQNAGVSCADSTTMDSAGVVHACQCSTNYPMWSARCWYENTTCVTVYAGGGTPCQGVPEGPTCGQQNWLYYCDGKGGAKANTYCAYGCAGAKCLGNDPCANAPRDGSWCGATLTTRIPERPLFQSVSADANTLYACSGGYSTSSKPCPSGCEVSANPGYESDACK